MPLGEDNLAWKAAAALWHAMGRTGPPMGARITIRKRIPAQAGLGGGSSDAAATLAGLHRLWRKPIAPRALVSLAATLGADVPFFLVGGAALGLGRGDEIYPLIDRPTQDVVIVRPSFGISTRDAYAWLADARFNTFPPHDVTVCRGAVQRRLCERPRARGRSASPRDSGNPAAAAAIGCEHCAHVRERLGSVWPLRHGRARASRRGPAAPAGMDRHAHQDHPAAAETTGICRDHRVGDIVRPAAFEGAGLVGPAPDPVR